MNREEIDRIIRQDTVWSPESDDYEEISVVDNGKVYKGYKHAMEKGDVCVRYYEDDDYVRAYALIPYYNGYVILFDKKYHSYFTSILGEDDGSWFLIDADWPIHLKSNFIACVSEALGIFNSNFSGK